MPPAACRRRIRRSSSATVSSVALPPVSGLNLYPLYRPGLWLAVIATPPPARRSTTPWLSTGVGTGASLMATGTPLAAATSATVSAKRSEAKRVS